jgi:hypothetical protein
MTSLKQNFLSLFDVGDNFAQRRQLNFPVDVFVLKFHRILI